MLITRYFDLILYKTFADLRAEAAKTYIGFLWWVLDPIIFMAIFYIVFGLLMRRGTEDFVPFLLVGLISWRWFQNTITHGANAILTSRGLIHQVYVPKVIFPVVVILTDLIKFTFVLTLLLIYLWLSGFAVNPTYSALPFLLAVQLALITGLTFLLAALVPFLPDLKLLAEHILHMMFFLSGIFFAGSSIPERYQTYFYLNPMANIIESYRDILMYRQWPHWQPLGVIAIVSILFTLFAYRLLVRNDQLYPKLVLR